MTNPATLTDNWQFSPSGTKLAPAAKGGALSIGALVGISVGLLLVLVVVLVVVLRWQCPKLFAKKEDDVGSLLMIPLGDDFDEFQELGEKTL
jgi:hypothetical protein